MNPLEDQQRRNAQFVIDYGKAVRRDRLPFLPVVLGATVIAPCLTSRVFMLTSDVLIVSLVMSGGVCILGWLAMGRVVPAEKRSWGVAALLWLIAAVLGVALGFVAVVMVVGLPNWTH